MTRFASLLLTGLLALHGALAATHEVKIKSRASGESLHAPQTLPTLRVSNAVKLTQVSSAHPVILASAPAAWPALTHHPAHAYPSGAGYAGVTGLATAQAALATTLGQSPLPALSVFPNPAHGQTTLQVSGPGGADYKVRLSNVLGGEVRRLPVRPENSPSDGVALDLSDLPPGLYFCSLLVNDKTLVTKRLTVL